MKRMKEKGAEILQKTAKKIVSTTVGKSFPVLIYEEEVPAEVQKWVREQRK